MTMVLFRLAYFAAIVAAFITLKCSANSSFQEKLHMIIISRSPPIAATTPDRLCRVIVVSEQEKVMESLNHPGGYLPPVELFQHRDAVQKSVQNFKFSPMCAHIIVDTTKALEVPVNRKWVNAHILNMKQLIVHFIIIGPKTALLSFLRTEAFDMLKYKTAFASDTKEVLIGDSGKYATATAAEIPLLPSEAELLKHRKMTFMLWKLEPYTVIESDGKLIGGFAFKHANEFCQHYNVSCTHKINMKPINQFPNGTWQGFMYDITEGDGDVLMALGVTPYRFGFVDFTAPVLIFEGRFMTSHPRFGTRWQALVYPFDSGVWAAISAVMVLLSPVYFAHFRSGIRGKKLGFGAAVFRSMAVPFALLLQEAIPIPRQAKFLTLMLIFYSLVVVTYYSSNLISFLTLPEKDALPTTFNELANTRHKFLIAHAYYPGSVLSAYLDQPTHPDAIKIRQVLDLNRNWLECTRRAVVEYNYICVNLQLSNEMFTIKNLTLNSNFRPFVESKDSIISTPLAAGMSWNSRYYTIFNRVTVRLGDTGHIQKWKQEGVNHVFVKSRPWMRQQVALNSDLARNLTRAMKEVEYLTLKPFSLKNFVLCFGSLLVGLSFGSIVLVCEVVRRFKSPSAVIYQVVRNLWDRLDTKSSCYAFLSSSAVVKRKDEKVLDY